MQLRKAHYPLQVRVAAEVPGTERWLRHKLIQPILELTKFQPTSADLSPNGNDFNIKGSWTPPEGWDVESTDAEDYYYNTVYPLIEAAHRVFPRLDVELDLDGPGVMTLSGLPTSFEMKGPRQILPLRSPDDVF